MKKKKKPKEEEEYYEGVVFVSYQSGNEPTDRMLKLMTKFVKSMQKAKIRTYWANQIGKPGEGCPPGGCITGE